MHSTISLSRGCRLSQAFRRENTMRLGLVTLLCLTCLSISCSNEQQPAQAAEPAGAIEVEVYKVDEGTVRECLNCDGDIEAAREVLVYASVPGKLYTKIRRIGEDVKKDEIVALLDRDEPALKFSYAEVKAPIRGTITRYFVEIGDEVLPPQPMPQKPIMSIADLDTVKVRALLNEREIVLIRRGMKATIEVDAFPDTVFLGRVTRIYPAVDAMTRKGEIEIEIPNPARVLRPGMFATCSLVLREKDNVPVVPAKAVVHREGKAVAFKVVSGRLVEQPVRLGIRDGDVFEVIDGLRLGDLIVRNHISGLIDGARVVVSGK